MRMKIEVRPVATNKTESVNPSRFDMAIVRNPGIILNYLFPYIKTTLYTYFVELLG